MLTIVSVISLVVLILLFTFVVYQTFLYNRTIKNYQDVITEIRDSLKHINDSFATSSKVMLDEISRNRTELLNTLSTTLKDISQTQLGQLRIFSENLDRLSQSNSESLSRINETLRTEINNLQQANEKKLEEMRKTVDEKLQTTLENRLSESFKTVSTQLENVYKGLGEMKNLASDVGDLKRVLTNVKQRGVFGELQLENILEDILTTGQYEKNIIIKERNQVEFAIKIPSKDEDNNYVLLPIDSKFPREDYERILTAQERADPDTLAESVKSLTNRIISEAKDISEKYLDPPKTTDFAILFLPVEGLFAEVLRIPGLFERIRKDYGVIITGPTTITAILNSLQMGFRTLAIEKRSTEVWKLLSAVKTEFTKFGEYLSKTKQKLEQAANEIDNAKKRTSIIDRKLRGVETLDPTESARVLGLDDENALEYNDRNDIYKNEK